MSLVSSQMCEEQAGVLRRAALQIHEGEKCFTKSSTVPGGGRAETFCPVKTPSCDRYPQGLGTTDSVLMRIMVSRAEIDMQDIKENFQKMYGKSLHSFIKVRSPYQTDWLFTFTFIFY